MEQKTLVNTSQTWQVGALCRAIADSLDARFNPLVVGGELSGFARAASGHCYFSLKDNQGQLRCAMFRRAASLLNFSPRDGMQVVLRGRLDVYGPRGDLQLIVEALELAGQGALYEQFLRLKAKLEGEGLFDSARKRALPAQPRGIAVVTSLDAAALRDVSSALARRAPHVPVLLVPAAVQGAQAPAELLAALRRVYAHIERGATPTVDTILLVRGGGSLEDLWAFNDEALARLIVQSPVPLVTGIGHETDFSLADFCADLRAPTPTAAAELAAPEREQSLRALAVLQQRLAQALARRLSQHSQTLDLAAARLAKPSAVLARHAASLSRLHQGLRYALGAQLQQKAANLGNQAGAFERALQTAFTSRQQHLVTQALRLELLNPERTLARGYAWVLNEQGQVVKSVAPLTVGQPLRLRVADGEAGIKVTHLEPQQP